MRNRIYVTLLTLSAISPASTVALTVIDTTHLKTLITATMETYCTVYKCITKVTTPKCSFIKINYFI